MRPLLPALDAGCAPDSLAYTNLILQQPGDPAPRPTATAKTANSGNADSTGFGIGLYGIVLIGGLLGYFGYQYLQAQEQQQTA